MYSNGTWDDTGMWCSAQPFALPFDMLGRRALHYQRDLEENYEIVRKHVRAVCWRLRILLRRDLDTQLFSRLQRRTHEDNKGKTFLLSVKSMRPGPPLHIAMSWVTRTWHRHALYKLFSGGWFLGRYSCNYFSRSFLPADRDFEEGLNFQKNQVCLHCWHNHRQIALECESHVLDYCPLYDAERHALLNSLGLNAQTIDISLISLLLQSSSAQFWEDFACFAYRVLQRRRREKKLFEKREARLASSAFTVRKAAWRSKGGMVCRHGVFFVNGQQPVCPCLKTDVEPQEWSRARYMPHLCQELRAITVIKFDASSFTRLGKIQAELRRSSW